MIRFFNRRSRKKSRDFKYNTSKTSLQNQYSHAQDSFDITRTSDGTLPTKRHVYEIGSGGGGDYGTYSPVTSGFAATNKPRYSSINALGSRDSGQDSPPEIVQYLRPPQNYSSPVRDSNAQMKDIPLTLPSPSRPPRSKDRKNSTDHITSDNNQTSINSSPVQPNVSQMAVSRTSPFASDTSTPSFHSPGSKTHQPRQHFSSLKPIQITSSNTEKSTVNKHIDAYNMQQGQAALGTSNSPADKPSVYMMNTRRKVFPVNQKLQTTSTFSTESAEPRVAHNPLPPAVDDTPHRSLPKPPEIPSAISGSYVTQTRGGNVASQQSSYVSRNTKIPPRDISDYSQIRQRVLVGEVVR